MEGTPFETPTARPRNGGPPEAEGFAGPKGKASGARQVEPKGKASVARRLKSQCGAKGKGLPCETSEISVRGWDSNRAGGRFSRPPGPRARGSHSRGAVHADVPRTGSGGPDGPDVASRRAPQAPSSPCGGVTKVSPPEGAHSSVRDYWTSYGRASMGPARTRHEPARAPHHGGHRALALDGWCVRPRCALPLVAVPWQSRTGQAKPVARSPERSFSTEYEPLPILSTSCGADAGTRPASPGVSLRPLA